MKILPETPSNKAVDHSIMFLLTGMMLHSIFLALPRSSSNQTDSSPFMLALLGALVVGVGFRH